MAYKFFYGRHAHGAYRVFMDVITRLREKSGESIEEFAKRHGMTGVGLRNLIRGKQSPSLEMWIGLAAEVGIKPRRAVLLWCQANLPDDLRHHIDPDNPAPPEISTAIDYRAARSRAEILRLADADGALPPALRKFLKDDESWGLYQPSGEEVNLLRDAFGPLGVGSVSLYRQTLAVLRMFRESNS